MLYIRLKDKNNIIFFRNLYNKNYMVSIFGQASNQKAYIKYKEIL